MTVSNSREKALKLARLGLPVFKVRLGADGTKTPIDKDGRGHLEATLDPGLVDDWFSENRSALVGVHVGPANLVVLDVDVKNGHNGWDSLEENWYTIPETFGYDTPSGGRHLIYRAPEGKNLAPSSKYRGMPGVDTRGGSSWVLWNGDVPDSLDAFAPAPDWLLDEKKVLSADEFQGSLKEWFDTLEPGEPSAVVRKAIDRIDPDMGHSEMVSATYEAIRLGAERHAGVPDLLAALEDAWLSRDPGNHTTPEDKWEWKFGEALNTGIQKYGAAIDLIRDMPAYTPALVPDVIPDSWVTGAPGGKTEFNRLMRKLVEVSDDDMAILSILWNAPTTRDLARDWGGVEFIHKRIVEQRDKSATAPTFDSPTVTLPEKTTPRSTSASPTGKIVLLNQVEQDHVAGVRTFIDTYMESVEKAVGFVQPAYAIPLAWTSLSMAFGRKAIVPYAGVMEMNIWAVVLGHSGTGKSVMFDFCIGGVLRTMFAGGEHPYFRIKGAGSSPEGWDLAVLQRDNMPTIMADDEAAEFFKGLLTREWMSGVPNKLSDWYMGKVTASSKVSLKELSGKTTRTSFNLFAIATPEDVLRAVTDDFFKNGFMARPIWVQGPPPSETDERYAATRADVDSEKGVSDQALILGWDLLHARHSTGPDVVEVWGSDEAVKRLEKAYRDMDKATQHHPRYASVIQPSVVRLNQTIWKIASLLALYRGETEFTLEDAVIALSYATEWLNTVVSISEQVAGIFQRDLNLIVDYIKEKGGRVARKDVLKHFTHMIVRTGRELSERVDYLVESGRLRTSFDKSQTYYETVED